MQVAPQSFFGPLDGLMAGGDQDEGITYTPRMTAPYSVQTSGAYTARGRVAGDAIVKLETCVFGSRCATPRRQVSYGHVEASPVDSWLILRQDECKAALQVLDKEIQMLTVHQGRKLLRERCLRLSERVTALAGEALGYGCQRSVSGAMDVYEWANSAIDKLVDLVKSCCDPWSIDHTFFLYQTDDEERFLALHAAAMDDVLRLDPELHSSVSSAIDELNVGNLSCDSGMCAVYSASSDAYFLAYCPDQKSRAFSMFGKTVEGKWSADRAMVISDVGEQSDLVRDLPRLDASIGSVVVAVEALNDGAICCSEELCIVYSVRKQAHVLLYTDEKANEASRLLASLQRQQSKSTL